MLQIHGKKFHDKITTIKDILRDLKKVWDYQIMQSKLKKTNFGKNNCSECANGRDGDQNAISFRKKKDQRATRGTGEAAHLPGEPSKRPFFLFQ